MAKVNFNDVNTRNERRNDFTKVGYFNTLKDDGDEAVVRFAYHNVDEFDLITIHTIEMGGKWRKVSCLRNSAQDPIQNCPFCEAGERLATKFYVKLVEYTRDDNGNIVSQAKVWERPLSFAKMLKSYFDEYGDISEYVFKIKRHGAKGSMQTTYDIVLANPNVYKPELYSKDFSAFSTLDLSKHSYYIMSKEEMAEYLDPTPANNGKESFTACVEEANKPIIDDEPKKASPTQAPWEDNTRVPWEDNTRAVNSWQTPTTATTLERPRRVYNY